MSKEKWPDAYLIGAPKAGTTSLHAFFRRHRSFFSPEQKYLRYFARELHPAFSWGKDEAAHRELYLRAFSSAATDRIAVDCENMTILNEAAAARIAAVRPDARIIAVLRDPVDRAWSHYFSDHERGADDREPAEALLGPPRAFPGMEVPERYIEAGLYGHLLARFARHFPRENILLIDYETMRDEPAATQKVICDFLGVADDPSVKLGEIRENVTLPARNDLVRYLFKQRFSRLRRVTRSLFWRLPAVLRQRFKRAAFASSVRRTMHPALRLKVIECYIGDVKFLESQFGFPTRHWLERWQNAPTE